VLLEYPAGVVERHLPAPEGHHPGPQAHVPLIQRRPPKWLHDSLSFRALPLPPAR
jgi:hypothetical protein